MLRNISVQFEPITVWPGKPTANQRRSQFKAQLGETYRLLERELCHLGCRRLVIQCNCDRSQIRQDGLLRSDARLNSPGIILSFDSKHGPLCYPCDTFKNWDCNLRAIALGLQALRAVDRYGVTKRAEQYRGWAALPPPNAPPPATAPGDDWTDVDAVRFLATIVGPGRVSKIPILEVLREAELATHPDRGGDPDAFKLVQRSRQLLA